MPPGDSAEDLGPREWHHYWDDFWTIGGLREAAFLARELGRADDAAWFERARRRSCARSSTRASRSFSSSTIIDHIPNGPEDPTVVVDGARAPRPAVWPLRLYPAT